MYQQRLDLEHSMSSGYYTEQMCFDLPDLNEYTTATTAANEQPSFIKLQLFKALGFEWK